MKIFSMHKAAGVALMAGFLVLVFQNPVEAGCGGKKCPLKSYGHHEKSGEEIPSLCDKFCSKVEFFMKNRKELSLSEEQIRDIQAKSFEVKKLLIETKAQQDVAMLELYQELHTPSPNLEKMKSLIDKKIESKRAKSYGLIEGLVSIKKYLSEEQMAKAKEIYWQQKYSSHGGH